MHPVALLADSPVRYTWPSPPLWLSSLTFKHSSSLAMLYPGSLFFYRLPKICPRLSKLHRLPSALPLLDRCAEPISGLSRTKKPLRNTPTPNVFSVALALRNGVAVSIRLAIPLCSADRCCLRSGESNFSSLVELRKRLTLDTQAAGEVTLTHKPVLRLCPYFSYHRETPMPGSRS